MIRDVVVHLHNEQPLLADLFDVPKPADNSLVCTNLRTMNGSRPVFVDDKDSTFVFPLGFIRFVELPSRSTRATATGTPAEQGHEPLALPSPDDDIELDEEFLRRIRDA